MGLKFKHTKIILKRILTFILALLLVSTFLDAQDTIVNQFLKNWKIVDQFGTVDTLTNDTAHLNFQNRNYIDNFSIANSFNGNLGSPIQSKVFSDRPIPSGFLFAESYYPYLQTINSNRFYNTKTPFSTLKYTTGGTNYRESDDVGFLFTANANKNLNFGVLMDYIYARGEYKNQSVKRFAGSLFGSYTGKRYAASGVISSNSLSNLENGGITDVSYILNPPYGYETPENIPVRIGVAAQSSFKQFQLHFNQQYSLGFEREVKKVKDSVVTEFVPVTRFIHTLQIDNFQKRYFENSPETSFYKNTYYTQTNDTAALQRVSNRLAVNLAEEFNKWMRFGLTAYVHNDIERYVYEKDSLLNDSLFTNIKIGGVLSKEIGQKLTYRISGEVGLIGYRAGDVLLSGVIGTKFRLWKDTISLKATAFSSTEEPDFHLQHYESNHFKWKNSFSKLFKTHIGGTFAIPTKQLSLEAAIENISNHIYFDTLAMPVQYDGSVQLLSLKLKKDFRLGRFGLDNTVVYQESLNDVVLPLPQLALYHNLYYIDKWFKVLSIQAGAYIRYHTSYYAPSYMPATGQFYNQRDMKIGNYPVMSVYANVHLKRTRFFAEYYHINQLFMKGNYYSMPNYPINPASFRMGLTWNFYD